MSVSKYKKYMTESFLYEAEKFKARSKESGKIVYYKTKDAMDAAIKDKKAEPIEKGDDKDDKKKPVSIDIDATGGLGGDDKDGGDKPKADKDGGGKPKGERPPSIHLGNDINSGGWDELDDSLDSLKYSGHKDDHPSISYQIGDLVDLLNSGQATDEELEKAREFGEKIDDLDSGWTREDDDHGMDELGRALGIAIEDATEKKSDTGGGDKPKGKVSEKPGGASHIESSGGNNVLLAKGTRDHIARHNKPGEGSVFSDEISMDDVQNAIGEIPEEFYEKGGGVHTTTVPNAGFNLVQKASDIEKNHPNAKKIKVKKQVGYDREKNEPIMKEVDAYIIDADKEEFATDQLNVVVRPSNPDFMDDELKNDSDVQQDLDDGKSHSVLTSFPGDPDVPPAQDWEESGHAIIIPNGGEGADETNWVKESIKVINGRKYKPIKEFKHPIKEQYDRLFTNKVVL